MPVRMDNSRAGDVSAFSNPVVTRHVWLNVHKNVKNLQVVLFYFLIENESTNKKFMSNSGEESSKQWFGPDLTLAECQIWANRAKLSF